MLSFGTERANIARRAMHQTMTNHFIFPLEAFPTFSPRTARHGAVMGTILRMHIGMRALSSVSWIQKDIVRRVNLLEKVLGLKRRCCTAWVRASEDTVQNRRTWMRDQGRKNTSGALNIQFVGSCAWRRPAACIAVCTLWSQGILSSGERRKLNAWSGRWRHVVGFRGGWIAVDRGWMAMRKFCRETTRSVCRTRKPRHIGTYRWREYCCSRCRRKLHAICILRRTTVQKGFQSTVVQRGKSKLAARRPRLIKFR